MAKFILVVPSDAKPGRDDDYNQWYESIHLKDVSAIPGITSGRRFESDPRSPAKPETKYLAIYEIDSDDPAAVLGELRRRGQSGEMELTDALDVSSARLMLFRAL
jgi:hypothetical protein